MRLGLVAASAIVLALLVGCGGNDRDGPVELAACLTKQGLAVEDADLHSFALTKISPDLAVHSDTETAWVIFSGSAQEAEEAGAELKRAEDKLGSYASKHPSPKVVEGNQVVVFRVEPSEEFRQQVLGCVAGGRG